MKISLSPNIFTPFVLVLTVGVRLARVSLAFLKLLNGRLLLDPVVSETKFCPLGVSDARLKLASFRRARLKLASVRRARLKLPTRV